MDEYGFRESYSGIFLLLTFGGRGGGGVGGEGVGAVKLLS